MGKIYRQGDVLFKKIDELPKNKRKIDDDIIVKGEATGHAHKIRNGVLNSSWQRGPRLYIKASKGAKVVHEEHEEIELDQGLYEVIRQKEYDPNAPADPWVED